MSVNLPGFLKQRKLASAVKVNWQSKYYGNSEEIKLLHSGNDYFNHLVELINSAQNILHLQTFIFGETETGTLVANALKEAAKRGVKVFVMVDAVGSKTLSPGFVKELKAAGIKFRFYSPFFSRRFIRFGRRLHHKITVADGHTALIGGVNVDNEYRGTDTVPAWLDFAVLVKGNVCEKPQRVCQMLWGKTYRLKYFNQEPELDTGASGPLVCFRRNDRLRLKSEISKSYLRSIGNAQKQVTIFAGYFLPSKRLLDALIHAAGRGVEVNIVVAGISDVALFPMATKYLYHKCLGNGINVYEWHKTVLHAKVAVVDNTWATIGSFNLNHLSAYGSIEGNLDVLNETFATNFQNHLTKLMQNDCEKITEDHLKRDWRTAFKYWFAYYFVRATLVVISYLPYLNFFGRKKKVTDTSQ